MACVSNMDKAGYICEIRTTPEIGTACSHNNSGSGDGFGSQGGNNEDRELGEHHGWNWNEVFLAN